MGQAKQRGTYEVRKAGAVERDKKRRMAMAEVARRKPSPKHVALMGMIAAMTQVHNAELCGGPSGPSERAPGYASGGKD